MGKKDEILRGRRQKRGGGRRGKKAGGKRGKKDFLETGKWIKCLRFVLVINWWSRIKNRTPMKKRRKMLR